MNAQKYTQKSLEAIQAAQSLPLQHQNQQIEQVHLLGALLQQEGGLIPQLLQKMGRAPGSLAAAVTKEITKLPSVTGSGREADKSLYLPGRSTRYCQEAESAAAQMHDDFVSVEHLFPGPV